MILILCDNFQEASDAFDVFCYFCEQYEPFMLRETDSYSLRCVTDDDLTYIFADERYGKIFDWKNCDITDPETFFSELFSRYDDAVLEDFSDILGTFFYGEPP